jgi:hypothetical protein
MRRCCAREIGKFGARPNKLVSLPNPGIFRCFALASRGCRLVQEEEADLLSLDHPPETCIVHVNS